MSLQLQAQALLELRRRGVALGAAWDGDRTADFPAWAERHFCVPDVIDPLSGEHLGERPVVLSPYQRRFLQEALSRNEDGCFLYSTVLWSDIKKSGKTAISAAVALWFASTQVNLGHVYCLANDGKGSHDREYTAICQAIALSRKRGGIFRGVKVRQGSLTLPNGTVIEAIPCDPEGEAGAEPDFTVWGEIWGYRQQHKLRLWTELTVPPTRWGHAMRWVESYAGYVGESVLLERLYELGVKKGAPHPDFLDLPVYANAAAGMLAMWNTEPRLSWQTAEYYAEEAAQLTAPEFQRVHRNQWVAPQSSFIPLERWDALKRDLPPVVDKSTLVVLALDASVSGDCCALVAVGKREGGTEVRGCQVWKPPEGGKIDYSKCFEPALRWWVENASVVMVAYDEYQLHQKALEWQMELGVHFHAFPQTKQRAVADKQLYDAIVQGSIAHGGFPDLREHLGNAAQKQEGEHIRIVKRGDRPVDAAVALSMANYQCGVLIF